MSHDNDSGKISVEKVQIFSLIWKIFCLSNNYYDTTHVDDTLSITAIEKNLNEKNFFFGVEENFLRSFFCADKWKH